MVLDEFDRLPDELEGIGPRDILDVFPNPALIRIEGRHKQPLFVSTLLHGNETTSFFVLQRLVRYLKDHPAPRSLLVFVGNVTGCAQGQRVLPGQIDYNRIWAGGGTEEHELAARVVAEARAAKPFASIDIHNNTGKNPMYGCIRHLEPQHINLATMFSPIIVHYTDPPTTQSIAFSEICPSITVECGQPGTEQGTQRAFDLVVDAMHASELPTHMPHKGDARFYREMGRVLVSPDVDFAFGDAPATFSLDDNLELANFSELKEGHVWGRMSGTGWPVRVEGNEGQDLTDEFFTLEDGVLKLKRAATPAMITKDLFIVRQDCLGYLMEELDVELA